MKRFITLLFLLLSTKVYALYPLEVQQLADNVYALVGEMEQRSDNNLANNATFGVIVTKAGVVLVDPGGSYQGAKQIDEAISTITKQPVKIVINSGGQDHRWLGNDYFKQKGAKVIASNAAVADHKARKGNQLFALQNLLNEGNLAGTKPQYADETFEETYKFQFGDVAFELIHAGPAHTPGDTIVWLPEQKIAFAGDIVYLERMLGVGPMSNSANWLVAFEKLESLNPEIIVPGHGHAAPLEKAKKQTYEYLVFLREQVAKMLDEGIGMERVGEIDQSRFSYLKVYEQLKGRNAQQVYTEMEWE